MRKKRPKPESSRLSDEQLTRMTPGELRQHGARMAKDRAEAAAMVGDFLMHLHKGKPIPRRTYGLVSWLIDPVISGSDPNPLPFPKSKGRPPGRGLRPFMQALEVERLRKQRTKESAVAAVAGTPEHETSVRKNYERTPRAAIKNVERSARRLRAFVSMKRPK